MLISLPRCRAVLGPQLLQPGSALTGPKPPTEPRPASPLQGWRRISTAQWSARPLSAQPPHGRSAQGAQRPRPSAHLRPGGPAPRSPAARGPAVPGRPRPTPWRVPCDQRPRRKSRLPPCCHGRRPGTAHWPQGLSLRRGGPVSAGGVAPQQLPPRRQGARGAPAAKQAPAGAPRTSGAQPGHNRGTSGAHPGHGWGMAGAQVLRRQEAARVCNSTDVSMCMWSFYGWRSQTRSREDNLWIRTLTGLTGTCAYLPVLTLQIFPCKYIYGSL